MTKIMWSVLLVLVPLVVLGQGAGGHTVPIGPYSDLSEHVSTLVAGLSTVGFVAIYLLWRIITRLEIKANELETSVNLLSKSLDSYKSELERKIGKTYSDWEREHHRCREWQMREFIHADDFKEWKNGRNELKRELIALQNEFRREFSDTAIEIKRDMDRLIDQIWTAVNNHRHDSTNGGVIRSGKGERG